MNHRLIFVVTVAAALAACGDDTGGAGGSGGSASTTSTGGEGGGDTSTTTSTGGDGGGATTSVTTTTTGGGGGDFQSLIDACEALDAALNDAATEAGLDCASDSSCEGVPGQFPGCEAEVEDLILCQTEGFDPAECTCTDTGLDCGIFTICQAELDAFTTCRDAQ